MTDTLKLRIEAACEAFFPYWSAIVEKDYGQACDLRERMARALAAGDPAIDLWLTEAQAAELAQKVAEKAVKELDYGWGIIEQAIGEEWRESATRAVSVEIRPILMALAKPAPAPKPTPAQLAETVVGGTRECPKCKAKIPFGVYCKGFDCPLNPSGPPGVFGGRGVPGPGYVSVTPPQGGVGATQKL